MGGRNEPSELILTLCSLEASFPGRSSSCASFTATSTTGLLKLRLETPSDLWRLARIVRPGDSCRVQHHETRP